MKNQNITEIARQLAAVNGIAISDIVGSGQNGRVLKSDVEGG